MPALGQPGPPQGLGIWRVSHRESLDFTGLEDGSCSHRNGKGYRGTLCEGRKDGGGNPMEGGGGVLCPRIRRESTEAWDGAEPDGLCVHEDKPRGKGLKEAVIPQRRWRCPPALTTRRSGDPMKGISRCPWMEVAPDQRKWAGAVGSSTPQAEIPFLTIPEAVSLFLSSPLSLITCQSLNALGSIFTHLHQIRMCRAGPFRPHLFSKKFRVSKSSGLGPEHHGQVAGSGTGARGGCGEARPAVSKAADVGHLPGVQGGEGLGERREQGHHSGRMGGRLCSAGM